MSENLFRVFWKPKNSNIVRWGEPVSLDVAKAWSINQNKEYPDIEHWYAIANSAETYEKANSVHTERDRHLDESATQESV